MKYQNLEIHGVNYEFYNQPKEAPREAVSIWEAYERPSATKIDIYNYWIDVALDLNAPIEYTGVCSYNSMQFTFTFIFELNNIKYLAYITKCHNRLYLLSE